MTSVDSSNPNDLEPLSPAEPIIEAFGGIRPMASKMGVAVTTVQGWKKRDTIPAPRVQAVFDCAKLFEISLPRIMPEAAAESTIAIETPDKPLSDITPSEIDTFYETGITSDNEPSQPQQTTSPPLSETKETGSQAFSTPPPHFAGASTNDIMDIIAQAERRAVKKSLWFSSALVAVIAGLLILLFWPESPEITPDEREAAIAKMQSLQSEVDGIQGDLAHIKEKQGFFGSVIPKDLNERLDALKAQASDTKNNASSLIQDMQAASNDLLNGQTGALRSHMAALEAQLDQLGNIPLMANLTQRYDAFTATVGGQSLLEQSTDELSSLLSRNDLSLEDTLDSARTTSPALNQTLEGVPKQDLKAAALLLTMTQLRSSLNRENEAFDGDLALLRKLVGDNAELNQAIDKLAPHAQSGVLTPSGLSDELRSLTGEVVVASLKGEDVSIKDRAKARLNAVLQIEQDGELVTNTQTQSTLAQTQNLIAQGDIAGAIAQMQTLDGAAAKAAQPWMNQANAALLAQEFKKTLSGVLAAKSAGLSGYTASGGRTGGELIYDPVSGTAVLKRNNIGRAMKSLKNLGE